MTIENVEAAYPLTPMQQGMLFHSVYAPESAMYCVQLCHRIAGPLNAVALRQAWQYLVDRHAALRTAFIWQQTNQPVQVVAAGTRLRWEEQDWSSLDEAEKDDRCRRYIEADRNRGFDLSSPPLMRMALLRLGDGDQQFVWSFHHLLLDGWSHAVLTRELAHAYGAFCAGRPPSLPPVRPYQDYLSWLQRQDPARAEGFWRRTLGGFTSPSPVRLRSSPEDVPAGGRQGRATVAIPDATATAVERFAQRHDATASTVVLGAWALTLAAYSGRDDVVFGSIASGRPPALNDVEDMVGLFSNTLPVRAAIDRRATVLTWLRDLQSQQIAARQFEYCAIADIQRWSDLEPGTTLFDAVLSFENFRDPAAGGVAGGAASRAGAIAIRSEPIWENVHHAVVLSVQLDDRNVTAFYDRARIPDAAIGDILERLNRSMDAIVAHGDSVLGSVTAIALAQSPQADPAHPGPAAPALPDTDVRDLFFDRAAAQPDAIALVQDGTHVTYAALRARALRLGACLRGRSIGPESIVGLAMPRSIDMVVAMLGILDAGAAVMPIDPGCPVDRLGYILTDARPGLIVTIAGAAAPFESAGIECVFVDRIDSATGEAGAVPPGERLSGNAAYVIYTSGSTGTPKGVVGLQSGLVNRLLWQGSAYPFAAGERVVAKSPLTFIDGITELLTPLVHGATVVLASEDAARNPSDLSSLIAREGIGRITLVPSLLRLFLESADPAQLRSCRLWIVSGEALPEPLAERFRSALPGARLINFYGASEGTGDSLFADCTQDAVSIGRPIWNTSAHVLNRGLDPVPPGVPGELHIGGAGLARGYMNRPDLTGSAFVPDPFSGVPGARLYRTGDLARLRDDGCVEYLGRADHQVKIRGYRVELGEIEATLCRHAAVKQAAAVVAGEPDRRLAAYVVLQPGDTTIDDLRRHLERHLPEYMWPSAIQVMSRMPATRSGKIDRTELSRRQVTADGSEQDEPPRGEREEKLAALFADVLKITRVAATASFVRLGGDSLQAVRLTARAKRAGITVTPRQILELRTVRALAAVAEFAPDAAPSRPAAPVARSFDLAPIDRTALSRIVSAHPDIEDLYPLTSAQQEMLLHGLAFPASELGTLQFCMDLDAAMQPALLREAWQRLLERHACLRVSIALDAAAEPLQVVHQRVPVPWHEYTWNTLTRDEGERELRAYLAKDRAAGFAFDKAPLVRLALIRWKDGRFSFVFTVHHLVLDGWSFTIVFRELAAIYTALATGARPDLSPAPAFREYVHWLQGQDRSIARRFWRERLQGFTTPVLLSSTAGATEGADLTTGEHLLHLPVETTRAVDALADDAGVTPAAVIQAAWALLLGRCAGVDDVVFGVTVAGRPTQVAGVDQMVGMFTSVLPIRVRVRPEGTLRALLAEVQERQLEMRPYEHTPRSVVHECSGLPLSIPLFESVVVFQDYDSATAQHRDVRDVRDGATSTFGVRTSAPVTVVVTPGPRLVVRVTCDARRVDPARARELTAGLGEVLHAFAASPGPYLDDVRIVTGPDLGRAGRGGAVDPGETERTLLSHADVGAAAVVTRRDARGDDRLVAYLVPKPSGTFLLQKIRHFARQRLPLAQVPAHYVVMQALPRTADGLVDAGALPSPAAQHSTSRVLLMGGASYDILEFQLARIWEEVFNISPVLPDDDFFALGGDSLLGLSLVTRIKTVLSHDVPLSALFETPTVREMAARLRTQSGASAWAPLVPIRKTGTRPPFFCVHPIGGNVLAFVDLVRHVDADIPFYALQSIGLDGAVEPYASVEQIAAHYLREIRAVQSEGPYYLGGFSFGGLVAFELARQLEQSGAIVGVVALLDMECPLVGGRLIFKESMAQHEATLLVQSSLTLRKHYAARPDDLREIEPLESQPLIARVLDHLRIPAQWRENARRVFTILLQSSRALRDYVPGPYGGTLTVFRSTDDAGAAEYAQLLQPGRERPEAMQAWQAFAAGGVDLVEVPGDHITMLTEPHVAVLGQRLTACLTRAERVHDGPVAGVAS